MTREPTAIYNAVARIRGDVVHAVRSYRVRTARGLFATEQRVYPVALCGAGKHRRGVWALGYVGRDVTCRRCKARAPVVVIESMTDLQLSAQVGVPLEEGQAHGGRWDI